MSGEPCLCQNIHTVITSVVYIALTPMQSHVCRALVSVFHGMHSYYPTWLFGFDPSNNSPFYASQAKQCSFFNTNARFALITDSVLYEQRPSRQTNNQETCTSITASNHHTNIDLSYFTSRVIRILSLPPSWSILNCCLSHPSDTSHTASAQSPSRVEKRPDLMFRTHSITLHCLARRNCIQKPNWGQLTSQVPLTQLFQLWL